MDFYLEFVDHSFYKMEFVKRFMAKIFISHRYTGENPKKLNIILNKLEQVLSSSGHDVFHSMQMEKYFIENGFTGKEILEECFEIQKDKDVFLAFVKSPKKSYGMEQESEKAREYGQKYVLAIRKGLDFECFRKCSDKVIEYSSLSELCNLLSKEKFDY
jgi:hypothetical protein